MRNSAALDIARWLASRGVGVFGGNSTATWSIAVNKEPSTPVDTITIYDLPGAGPDTDELSPVRQNLQVRVRSASFERAYAISAEVMELLHAYATGIVGSTHYIQVLATTDVFSLGTTEEDNHLLVADYSVIRD